MFDWKEGTKEKYYKIAESILEVNSLRCFEIDRARATLVKGRWIKVYFKPFNKRDISVHQLAAVKRIEGVTITNDRYTRTKPGKEKPITENGYILLPLDTTDL